MQITFRLNKLLSARCAAGNQIRLHGNVTTFSALDQQQPAPKSKKAYFYVCTLEKRNWM
jgi:hypothetical protein